MMIVHSVLYMIGTCFPLCRQNTNLQAVDVSGTIAHSRSSSSGGSPRPKHKRSSNPKDSVSSLVTAGKPTR